jgi:hypothetical protein
MLALDGLSMTFTYRVQGKMQMALICAPGIGIELGNSKGSSKVFNTMKG